MKNHLNKINRTHFLLSDTIIVASSTVLAYLFTFNFEYGITQTFHIPVYMIEVGLTTAITAWTIMFVGFVPIMIMLANLTAPLILKLHKTLRSLLVHLILSLAFCAFLLTILNIWHLWLILGGAVIGGNLILPILDWVSSRRNKRPFLSALEERINASSQNPHFYQRLNIWFGPLGKAITSMLLIGYVASFYLGVFHANWNPRFLIRNSNPEMVVLRLYGDKFICAHFDRSTKEIQKNIFILKASDDFKTSYTYERIGPLRAPK